METVHLKLWLDMEYRKSVEAYGVKFEDYLQGVLYDHFLNGGDWDQLCLRLDRGNLSAKLTLFNRAGVGSTLESEQEGD